MNRVPVVLQAGGLLAMTAGAFDLARWLGLLVLGVGLTVFGVAAERDN